MVEKSRTRASKKEDVSTRIERLEALLENGHKSPSAGGQTAYRTSRADTAELEKRIEALEERVLSAAEGGGEEEESATEAAPLGYCAVPYTPPRVFGPEVSENRARLIEVVSKKWVNGTKLRYYFFESGPESAGNDQKDIVRQGFEVWKNVGIGLKFEEVRDQNAAEVRIGFVQGDGAWSYIGRDVIDIPGQSERTMNFGWDLRTDPRGVDVPVHEIGHTLGFPHEHQNPFAGLVWDEEAVYRYFADPPNNWPRATTEFNILRKLSTNEVQGTQWDPDSIMHYAFAAGLIIQPEQYRNGLRPHGGLSPHDLAQAKIFYPPQIDDAGNPELKPFRSQTLTLAPAQQANFTILPTATRTYTMQTFGGSDVVMVLFEDVNGDLRFMDGDDDSGTALNARIQVRLMAGRRYVLRIRMFSNHDSGESAVLLW